MMANAHRATDAYRAIQGIERLPLIIGEAGRPSDFVHFGADPKRAALVEAKRLAKREMERTRLAIQPKADYDPFLDEQDEESTPYVLAEREYRALSAALKAYDAEQKAAYAGEEV